MHMNFSFRYRGKALQIYHPRCDNPFSIHWAGNRYFVCRRCGYVLEGKDRKRANFILDMEQL